jgi:hypothetical protein
VHANDFVIASSPLKRLFLPEDMQIKMTFFQALY